VAKVAVVVTVLNEKDHIKELISALKHQNQPPAEVVVVDGGSTDGTWETLKSETPKWHILRSLQKPGNRSVGRNAGIMATKSPIIAMTDAGCVPDANWLKELTAPFSKSEVKVVSGFYRGLPHTVFQKCVIPYVLVMPDQAQKTEFFPSTRSMALRRSVYKQSGGFDIRLWHNEDYAYAHGLKKMGITFVFAPTAVVGWYPRARLSEVAWMFLRFAIGDIQAGILRPKIKLLALRYILGVYLFLYLWELNPTISVYYLLLLGTTYSIWACVKNYNYVKDPKAFFWLPVLQYTADGCILFGTLIGLLLRTTWATNKQS